MTRLSILIPNRNSRFTTPTVHDLLANARGDVEVIVAVDEQWPEPRVTDRRVTYLPPADSPLGLRAGVNRAAAVATGEYVMKTDDHCAFGPGYDLILIAAHAEDNWVQIPRRYSLDAEHWCINRERPHRDYMYLCYPELGKKHDDGIHGVEWYDRQRQRADSRYDIDETPSLQGSCWFMTRHHLTATLGGLQALGYGPFAQEAQEIGLKTWLGGGALMVNKRTWYAHLHKGKQYGRMYRFSDRANVAGINWSARHWLNDEEPGLRYPFAWFIDEQFPGMPGWPADWQARLRATGQIANAHAVV
jgi:hypothetical protein